MTQRDCEQSRQAGFSLLEAILVLALMASATVGLGYAMKANSDSIRLAGFASQLSTLRAAADRYVQDNFASLANATAAGPIAVSVSTIASGQYLAPGFPTTNPNGQTYSLYLRRRSDKVLESMVIATGGTGLTPSEGNVVAALLKASGGYVREGGATAVGTKASWSTPLSAFVPLGAPTPSGSAVAYSIHYAVTGPTGALIRYVTGNPADNRMSTDLDMAGNRIINVANLGATNVSATTVSATNVSTNVLTIGGQQLALSDAQTLAALSAASCGAGYALTKSGSSIYCVAIPSVPTGTIAAFEGGCPAGWGLYSAAADRVLVGAGGAYSAGQTGGADSVTLTKDQMPEHAHHLFANQSGSYATQPLYPDSAPNYSASGRSSGASYDIGSSPWGRATIGLSEKVGGNRSFDNRQQFVAVNYCRRQ